MIFIEGESPLGMYITPPCPVYVDYLEKKQFEIFIFLFS